VRRHTSWADASRRQTTAAWLFGPNRMRNDAAAVLAEAEHLTTSEIIRRALRRYLDVA
jgi:hypothetical protein